MTTPVPRITDNTGPGSMDAAVLRIFAAQGNVVSGRSVGLGFLVTERLALTCAHVVAAALGARNSGQSLVGAQVWVDLPLSGRSTQTSGVVATVEVWIPQLSSGAGDVVLLRLGASLVGAQPVRLVDIGQMWGHSARTFGLPDGRPGGVWHSGVLRHRQANGWVQLDLAGNGYRVSPGFSGGPVWDDELAGVVGMTVMAEAGHPPASYLIPVAELLEVLPSLRPLVAPPSPFRGLRPFVEADAGLFHGRRNESGQISDIVASARWTTLTGPSGCGKSSLAMAGVLPRRRAAGDCPTVIRPGHHTSPLHALAAGLLPLLEPELSETELLVKTSTLARFMAEQGLGEIVLRVLEPRRADRLLVVVDQFEELLNVAPPLVDDLARVLFDDGTPASVRVLCTLRADFLEPMLAHPRLGPVVSKRVVALEPMRPQQLHEIITKPVKAIPGMDYEHNLAERIMADAGTEPGALPLLGFTLDLLWERQEQGLLTHRAYADIGEVAGALGDYADRAWAEHISAAEEPAAARLLTQLTRVPIGGTAATRRIVPHSDLDEQTWCIAQRLAATRLLVIKGGEGPETVELAHEALITGWSRLVRQIAADRSFLDWRESLRHDLSRWERGKRNIELLPSPATLAGATGREGDLTDGEREYLRQGRTRRRARTRRRRGLIAVLGVLILAAGSGGIVAAQEQQAAAQRAAVVRSGTLAVDSGDLLTSDPGLAGQLAVAAYRAAPTQDASSALYAALQSPLLDDILTTAATGIVDRTAAQADGPLGAAIDSSGTVRVWNLDASPAPVLESTLTTTGTTGIALSPRAPVLAAACGDGVLEIAPPAGKVRNLCLWNLTAPVHPVMAAQLPTPTHGLVHISSMAISQDGNLLAAASESGFTWLWSITDPAHPRLLASLPSPTTNPTPLAAVTFSPTGSLLAESIQGGATRLWSLANPNAPASLGTINSGYQEIVFDPAANLLAGANDTTLDLWDISNPAAPTQIKIAPTADPNGVTQDLQTLSISPDGHTLAYGGTDVESGNAGLCLLNLTSVAQDPDTQPICISTGFSTDTMTYTRSGALLTGGLDSTVRLWHASPAAITNANGYGFDIPLAVSHNGRLLAAAISPTDEGSPSIVGIWNLDAPGAPTLEATLPPSSAAVGATFVNDKVVLCITQNAQVQLWNITDLRHPWQIASLGSTSSATSGLYNITFNPARNIVAVLGNKGVLNLWHVTSTGSATMIGSLTDPAAANDIGGILQAGNTAFMSTPTGIDWWNISNPAHPVKTGSSPLTKASEGASEDSMTTLFAASSAPDPIGDGGTLNLYNLDDGQARTTTLTRHAGNLMGFSADGRRLAASSTFGNELTIWDTTNARAPKPTSSVLTAFGIGGVAFGSGDNLMADWNVETLQLWDIMNPEAPVLVGSFNPVSYSLGSNLNETLTSASFTPGGKLLITVAVEGPSLAYLFDTNAGQTVDQLCSITTNPITPAQWAQYAPGIPYQAPC